MEKVMKLGLGLFVIALFGKVFLLVAPAMFWIFKDSIPLVLCILLAWLLRKKVRPFATLVVSYGIILAAAYPGYQYLF